MKLEAAKGDWALITGASSGIGREFAQQLGAAGVNLILVARREALLQELASNLSHQYGIRGIPIAVDLSHYSTIETIKSRIKKESIKVRILVNNAAHATWGKFEDKPLQTYEKMITINILSPVALSHHFLEDLSSYPTSAIINVSSPAALNPMPYLAAYAATKAFLFSFSQSLYGEWSERGVLVQTLLPGPTETELGVAAAEFSKVFNKRADVKSVVEESLHRLERETPLVITAKGTLKQRLFATLFPAKFVIKTLTRMFRTS